MKKVPLLICFHQLRPCILHLGLLVYSRRVDSFDPGRAGATIELIARHPDGSEPAHHQSAGETPDETAGQVREVPLMHMLAHMAEARAHPLERRYFVRVLLEALLSAGALASILKRT